MRLDELRPEQGQHPLIPREPTSPLERGDRVTREQDWPLPWQEWGLPLLQLRRWPDRVRPDFGHRDALFLPDRE